MAGHFRDQPPDRVSSVKPWRYLPLNSFSLGQIAKMPGISVVIPTHLRPALLQEAIDSVLAQTLPPSEIVVVDDADDRDTKDVVARSSQAASFAIRHVANAAGGVCHSRNIGASAATGAWVAMLDDDDTWAPSFLKDLSDRLDASGADMAIGGLVRYEGQLEPTLRLQPDNLTSQTVLKQNGSLTGSNFIISRTAYDEIGGFDPTVPVFNDWDFFVRFLDAGFKYCVVAGPLAHWRDHSGPRIATPSLKRATGIQAFIDRYSPRMSRQVYRDLRTTALGVRRQHAKGLLQKLILSAKLAAAHGARNTITRAVKPLVRRVGAAGK
ncbi:glycosyltransferase family A protein [Sphingomonas aerolata]|uniref:glycosyltransferase family 2 protein n=1 Tax=Sphingomonas aerolata TaxID=185951 RepID=UPI0035A72C9B